jgi:hypothetical protein
MVLLGFFSVQRRRRLSSVINKVYEHSERGNIEHECILAINTHMDARTVGTPARLTDIFLEYLFVMKVDYKL